jgi:hypothetical protein
MECPVNIPKCDNEKISYGHILSIFSLKRMKILNNLSDEIKDGMNLELYYQ